jgi:acetylornithine deacetylase
LATAPDTLADAVILLERLVGFDTVSSRSNLALIHFVETYLRDRGVPYVITYNPAGDKAALLATIGPMVDGGIVLSGHTDVVSPEGQAWHSHPFSMRRADGKLYGRGTCDRKGFAAIGLAMAPEFLKAELRVPVHILLSYDEETTCLGPVDLISRFGVDLPRPRAVIVGEPTMMQVADAHKSISTYMTRVRGHEAHSSKPQLGANAIQAACALVGELYRIADVLERQGDAGGRFDPAYSTVHVGTIQGGTVRNILAGECHFEWEFRGLPGVPYDTALRPFEVYVKDVALPQLTRSGHDVAITTQTQVDIPGLSAEPGSSAATLALKLTNSNRTIAVAYATEAGRFQAANLPTIVCGPGNIDQAHQPNEYLDMSQVVACIGFMRRLAGELV